MTGALGWRWAAAGFWLSAGANHFINRKFYEEIVPPPLDRWKGEVNLLAGAAELTGGALVLGDRTRPAARWWLLATLAAIYPANIHMALRPERFPRYPAPLLWARLPVQGLFALLTWRGTAP
jgi:uncharacterized membrane protein